MRDFLSAAERQRFIDWLEHEVASGEGLIRQMESIHAPAVVLQKYRVEAMAAKVIAEKLRSIHDEVV